MSKSKKPLKYELTVRHYCKDGKCPFDRSAVMSYSNKKEHKEAMQRLYSAHLTDKANEPHEQLKHTNQYMEILKQTIAVIDKK